MPSQPANTPSTHLLRAAQYLRMSTDRQQYSTVNQSAAIALYAAAHNIGIVRSFVDEGKSGTTIKGRKALQELLRTVESGTADFDLILAKPHTTSFCARKPALAFATVPSNLKTTTAQRPIC